MTPADRAALAGGIGEAVLHFADRAPLGYRLAVDRAPADHATHLAVSFAAHGRHLHVAELVLDLDALGRHSSPAFVFQYAVERMLETMRRYAQREGL